MPKETLNVSVVGLGRMGQLHAAAYDKMPLINLKAICDTDEKRLAHFCEKFSAKGYTDYNEMLKDETIDAVNICLPDNMHRDAVVSALKKNKHILCEKPLTIKLDEAKEIAELQKNSDKVFMVGYSLRFSDRHKALKHSYDKGELGEAIFIYERRNSSIIGPMHYAGYSDLVEHVMIHDIDFTNWLLKSKPENVFAKSRSVLLKEKNMTDVIFAFLEYPCGTMVCLEACWVLPEFMPPALDDNLEFIGTKGAVYIENGDLGISYVLNDRQAVKPVFCGTPFITEEVGATYYDEITYFVNCILKDTPADMSCQDSIDAIEVVEAIKRSIRDGCKIVL